MSKTVIEMAREAGCVEAGHPFNPWSVNQEALERLVELIVEECVAQVWTVSEMEHKGNILSECSKRMRKHFGVEK